MLRVAVTVFWLGLLTSPSTAQQGRLQGLRTWPEQAGWVTYMAPISGSYICSTTSKKGGSVSIPLTSFSFSFTRRNAHFFVDYAGQELRVGPSLLLSVDGAAIMNLPVLSHERIPHAGYQVMANLPGSDVKKFLDALGQGSHLQIDVGDRRFTMGIAGFPAVLRQMGECFTAAHIMD